jgi:hypothetical protein
MKGAPRRKMGSGPNIGYNVDRYYSRYGGWGVKELLET